MSAINKCPCGECITYAICLNSPSIKQLVEKCTILNDYINSKYRTLKVIRVIRPRWYTDPQRGEPTMKEGAINILNYSILIKKAREREK